MHGLLPRQLFNWLHRTDATRPALAAQVAEWDLRPLHWNSSLRPVVEGDVQDEHAIVRLHPGGVLHAHCIGSAWDTHPLSSRLLTMPLLCADGRRKATGSALQTPTSKRKRMPLPMRPGSPPEDCQGEDPEECIPETGAKIGGSGRFPVDSTANIRQPRFGVNIGCPSCCAACGALWLITAAVSALVNTRQLKIRSRLEGDVPCCQLLWEGWLFRWQGAVGSTSYLLFLRPAGSIPLAREAPLDSAFGEEGHHSHSADFPGACAGEPTRIHRQHSCGVMNSGACDLAHQALKHNRAWDALSSAAGHSRSCLCCKTHTLRHHLG